MLNILPYSREGPILLFFKMKIGADVMITHTKLGLDVAEF